ncbi:hypothetical protein AB3329_04625 [Streptococcus sp. H31]|uniref:hypothetical protein n=1 Tax=Streptococcus huangxiaojuni TaxID=3237239 RepID=UPI0034A1D6A8
MKNDLLNIENTEEIEKNIVRLIDDEDTGIVGASTPAVISAATAVSALLQVTTACTKDCRHR